METQKFFLKIDAESPDGEAVKCETHVKINCDRKLSAAILANLLKEHADVKEMFMDAFLLILTSEDETIAEKISDEEFSKRSKNNNDEDVEL